MINFQLLDNTTPDANSQTAYTRLRFDIILKAESSVRTAYLDTKGIPTIGIGFNLRDDQILKLVLNAFGVDTRPPSTALKDFHDIVYASYANNTALRTALDAEMLKQHNANPAIRSTFTFSSGIAGEDEMRLAFNEAVKIYDNPDPLNPGRVDNWLAGIPPSKERAVLASMSWNGLINTGTMKPLRNAVLSGNRAEAWFNVRYAANYAGMRFSQTGTITKYQTPDPTSGKATDQIWANRRYYESTQFSLYDDPAAPISLAEAKDIYRMFTLHRAEIAAYEKVYGIAFDGSQGTRGNNLGDTAYGIHQMLEAAKMTILGDLGANANQDITNAYQKWVVMPGNDPMSFNATNLYLDPGRVSARDPIDVNSSVNIDASQSSQNSVLIGEGGTPGTKGDNLFGGSGNDLLIGGNGDDTLSGGGGINFMAGGEGNDTYILDAGGTYTIEDKIGTNRVMLDRTVIGRLIRQSDGSYKSDDGKLTANMQGTDLVVFDIDTYTTVTLNADFQSGDFGITLSEAPQITRTITGDLTPIVYGTDGSGNPVYHYDDLGNPITDGSVTIVDDTLNGSTGNDLITGGLGSDILIGRGADDKIFADYEEEIALAIEHGNTQEGLGLRGDWLAGGEGDDTLVGSRGNDVLTGGAGRDLLIGGAGDDDILGDNDWIPLDDTWSVTGEIHRYFEPLHISSVDQPAGGDADIIHCGEGNDHAVGGAGDDVLYGDGGHDVLWGNSGADVIFGGSGNDRIYGDREVVPGGGVVEGDDYLDGGDGDDIIYADGGNDTLFGGAGNDGLYGGDGANYLDGEDDDDTLRGGAGDDDLFGGAGNDGLYGGDGANYLDGEDGHDELASDGAGSTLFGGAGDDTLFGYGGGSYLDGEEGNNQLVAYLGNNQLQGGAGNDNFWAYGGSSTLAGKGGARAILFEQSKGRAANDAEGTVAA